jgi:hypothetical protein
MKSPSKNGHIAETDLALYVSGDLNLVRLLAVRFHARSCDRCLASIEKYRSDLALVKEIADEMPDGVNWDRLSREMTANIHLGLAAGECVAPVSRMSRGWAKRDRRPMRVNWKLAAASGGAMALLTVAWLLNMPAGTTSELGRAMSAILHGKGSVVDTKFAGMTEDRGPVVFATQQGIEVRENNNSMGGSDDARPVAVTVSLHGSASERHVNADTGQMTITSVYVQ